MKDTRTILLILLSVGLVSTWVYHLYDKTRYAQQINATPPTEKLSVKELQDSLQKVYSLTVTDLSAQLDSARNAAGLLKSELTAKLDEINLLKQEIAILLQKNNASKADMDLAGRKTTQLKQLVAGLPSKNNNNVREVKEQPVSNAVYTDPGIKNELPNDKPKIASVFTASDVRITSIRITEEKEEEETNEAENTNKLVISFAVRNGNEDYTNAEVFAVVTQPDGRVLQTDQWETAMINTHEFGRKIYTRKIRFEYQKGETKQLQLTLRPEDYEKGNYRLQVFHNGYLIGETTKRLN